MTHLCLSHGSLVRMTWLNDTTQWHDSMTRLNRMCAMTFYVSWPNLVLTSPPCFRTWLMHVCAMTHLCERHDSIVCMPWLLHICIRVSTLVTVSPPCCRHVTHRCLWHDSFTCVWHDSLCVPPRSRDCVAPCFRHVTHECPWHGLFTFWLIKVCGTSHLHVWLVWHDSLSVLPKSHLSHHMYFSKNRDRVAPLIQDVIYMCDLCDMTHYLSSQNLVTALHQRDSWLKHVCDRTHLYVCGVTHACL